MRIYCDGECVSCSRGSRSIDQNEVILAYSCIKCARIFFCVTGVTVKSENKNSTYWCPNCFDQRLSLQQTDEIDLRGKLNKGTGLDDLFETYYRKQSDLTAVKEDTSVKSNIKKRFSSFKMNRQINKEKRNWEIQFNKYNKSKQQYSDKINEIKELMKQAHSDSVLNQLLESEKTIDVLITDLTNQLNNFDPSLYQPEISEEISIEKETQIEELNSIQEKHKSFIVELRVYRKEIRNTIETEKLTEFIKKIDKIKSQRRTIYRHLMLQLQRPISNEKEVTQILDETKELASFTYEWQNFLDSVKITEFKAKTRDDVKDFHELQNIELKKSKQEEENARNVFKDLVKDYQVEKESETWKSTYKSIEDITKSWNVKYTNLDKIMNKEFSNIQEILTLKDEKDKLIESLNLIHQIIAKIDINEYEVTLTKVKDNIKDLQIIINKKKKDIEKLETKLLEKQNKVERSDWKTKIDLSKDIINQYNQISEEIKLLINNPEQNKDKINNLNSTNKEIIKLKNEVEELIHEINRINFVSITNSEKAETLESLSVINNNILKNTEILSQTADFLHKEIETKKGIEDLQKETRNFKRIQDSWESIFNKIHQEIQVQDLSLEKLDETLLESKKLPIINNKLIQFLNDNINLGQYLEEDLTNVENLISKINENTKENENQYTNLLSKIKNLKEEINTKAAIKTWERIKSDIEKNKEDWEKEFHSIQSNLENIKVDDKLLDKLNNLSELRILWNKTLTNTKNINFTESLNPEINDFITTNQKMIEDTQQSEKELNKQIANKEENIKNEIEKKKWKNISDSINKVKKKWTNLVKQLKRLIEPTSIQERDFDKIDEKLKELESLKEEFIVLRKEIDTIDFSTDITEEMNEFSKEFDEYQKTMDSTIKELDKDLEKAKEIEEKIKIESVTMIDAEEIEDDIKTTSSEIETKEISSKIAEEELSKPKSASPKLILYDSKGEIIKQVDEPKPFIILINFGSWEGKKKYRLDILDNKEKLRSYYIKSSIKSSVILHIPVIKISKDQHLIIRAKITSETKETINLEKVLQ